MSYTVTAVDRALMLLEVLADNPDLGVTEIAERTGQTKSLVFRLLYTCLLYTSPSPRDS